MAEKIIVSNRRAFHDYQVLDKIEAGVALMGAEVKSLRNAGSMTLKDSFAEVRSGEAYLVGAHIKPYAQANIQSPPPERERKLLLHRAEIDRLAQRVAEKGLTLIPLRVYFKRGIVKIELGLCRGKRQHDKREAIKAKESKREMDRAIKSVRGSGE